jgi:hypothetical protein
MHAGLVPRSATWLNYCLHAGLVNTLQFELTGLVCLLAAPAQGQTSAPSRAHLHPAAATAAGNNMRLLGPEHDCQTARGAVTPQRVFHSLQACPHIEAGLK